MLGTLLLAAQSVFLVPGDVTPVTRDEVAAAIERRGIAVSDDPAATMVVLDTDPDGVRVVVRDDRGVIDDRVLAPGAAAQLVEEALEKGAERRYEAERIEVLPRRQALLYFDPKTGYAKMWAVRDGRPLKPDEFFEAVGRPELAVRLHERQATGTRLIMAGFGLQGGALLFLLGVLATIDVVPRDVSLTGALAGAGASLAGAGIVVWGVWEKRSPTHRTYEQLAAEHNAELRGRLGVRRSSWNLQVFPVDSSGAGVGLVARF